ncbi:MAG: hypothetical protein A3F35_02720 [Candidatus Woykebacteria bacterium RIFCSPHIGHO2_12_FULL_45_10]|uniref:Uncharacterized protein n=1 Tax=Candidatus Woykebacteria bacterium RIFCSPHIGHO2_12_FULL_45_10 TaxID=1802603 RepID=A0A1G1WMS0_9BACT|nr:MAG: hypothetical protein A3F35_02720 [Candidatus Woykebacteria bacterium RIFCSPHIGHO2_12_FULL_45_10]
MPDFVEKPTKKFPWITRIFIFIYCLLFLFAAGLPLFYQQLPILATLKIDQSFVLIPSIATAVYFLIIGFSFFRAGDNWLIFSIILIFFSTLGALGLAALGGINVQHLIAKGIPSCINNINLCNANDGIVLASAVLLGISIPTILFNILTFVGIMKSFGARDPYE